MVLTADHGAPPVAPSYVDLQSVPDRLAPVLAEAGLPSFVHIDGHGIWLDEQLDTAALVSAVPLVESVVAGIVGVEAVVVPAAVAPDQPFADAYAAGVVPGRSADFELLLADNHVALYPPAGARGTTHGSPRAYDRDVPLLAMGPGVRPGSGRVDVRSVAPSLAALAGLSGPADATVAAGPYVAAAVSSEADLP